MDHAPVYISSNTCNGKRIFDANPKPHRVQKPSAKVHHNSPVQIVFEHGQHVIVLYEGFPEQILFRFLKVAKQQFLKSKEHFETTSPPIATSPRDSSTKKQLVLSSSTSPVPSAFAVKYILDWMTVQSEAKQAVPLPVPDYQQIGFASMLNLHKAVSVFGLVWLTDNAGLCPAVKTRHNILNRIRGAPLSVSETCGLWSHLHADKGVIKLLIKETVRHYENGNIAAYSELDAALCNYYASIPELNNTFNQTSSSRNQTTGHRKDVAPEPRKVIVVK